MEQKNKYSEIMSFIANDIDEVRTAVSCQEVKDKMDDANYKTLKNLNEQLAIIYSELVILIYDGRKNDKEKFEIIKDFIKTNYDFYQRYIDKYSYDHIIVNVRYQAFKTIYNKIIEVESNE